MVPLTVMVYVPFGAFVDVDFVEVDVEFPLLPHPDRTRVSEASERIPHSMGQRRRRNAGKPTKTSDRNTVPAIPRIGVKELGPLSFVVETPATLNRFTAAETHALDEVKMVIVPVVVAVGFV